MAEAVDELVLLVKDGLSCWSVIFCEPSILDVVRE